MATMKYVIVNLAFADLAPIVFRDDIGHDVATLGFRTAVDSAGFVTISTDDLGRISAKAFGHSIGLGLPSKADRDSEILTRFFNRAVEPVIYDAKRPVPETGL